MKYTYETFRQLLAGLSPSGTRTGSVSMNFEYTWPFGGGVVDRLQKLAEAHGLIVEEQCEAGLFKRHGHIKVRGKEAAMWLFVFEMVTTTRGDWS
jgi:hypothetical protein